MKQLFPPLKQLLRVWEGLLEIQHLHETCSNFLWKHNNYFYQCHKLFKIIWITTKSLYNSALWSAKSPGRHTYHIIYHFHAKHWKINAREENRNYVINSHCEVNGRSSQMRGGSWAYSKFPLSFEISNELFIYRTKFWLVLQ